MSKTLIYALGRSLSLNQSQSSTVFQESRHKLANTYINYQGDIVHVNEFNSEGMRYTVPTGKTFYANFDSPCLEDGIQFLNIESGIYIINNIPVKVVRRVLKSYKKSFCPEAYSIGPFLVDDAEAFFNYFSYYNLFNKKRETIYRYKNSIYYGTTVIGQIEQSRITPIAFYEMEIDEALQSGTIKI